MKEQEKVEENVLGVENMFITDTQNSINWEQLCLLCRQRSVQLKGKIEIFLYYYMKSNYCIISKNANSSAQKEMIFF